ncbi:hypothetical protein [Dokdonella sp.]|uniref:hypothetical protein n=1 Tax=Dokdonella sp. TaxID=2291710 RepID=UPI00352825CC
MTNWLHIALTAGLVYAGLLCYFAAKRQWTWAALGVALANFLYVLLNLAAPFRGLLDPDYAGYKMGMLQIAPGAWVTVVSGGIVVAALAAACFALLGRPGRGMVYIALTDTALLLLIGLPELVSGLMDYQAYRIELGEYLKIPGLVAVLVSGALFCLPLLLSIVWSTRRMRPRMTRPMDTKAQAHSSHS